MAEGQTLDRLDLATSVLAYQEADSLNVFDRGGGGIRSYLGARWGGASITRIALFRQMHWRNSLAQNITGYTTIPGGSAGWAGTLGGSGLAVSEHSSHPKEAIELVRFLIRTQIHSNQVDDSCRWEDFMAQIPYQRQVGPPRR